jgi:hypothetical protein
MLTQWTQNRHPGSTRCLDALLLQEQNGHAHVAGCPDAPEVPFCRAAGDRLAGFSWRIMPNAGTFESSCVRAVAVQPVSRSFYAAIVAPATPSFGHNKALGAKVMAALVPAGWQRAGRL